MMKFPNAASGVKKIFAAEIMSLISAFAMIGALVMVVLTIGAAADNAETNAIVSGIGTIVLFAATGVLLLISFILNIVGIAKAARDESNFKKAVVCLLIGIAASIAGMALTNVNPAIESVMSVVSELFGLLVTIFVIAGITRLADRLNRGDVAASGRNLLLMIIVVNLLALAANLVVTFMGGKTASIAAGVIAIAALVLDIIKYIMYLVFLSKGNKMLSKG